jgi:starch synthase
MTPEFGTGLHEFLQSRSEDVSGILNGLDQERWNPQTDPALITNYSIESLDVRTSNKTALQAELDLEIDPQIPMLAIISRFDPQKGIDLLPDALRAVSDQPWQAVILGTGAPYLERTMQDLEVEFSGRLRSIIRFDSNLSRRIYASADALLIPSRYEPCGLTQMIAMRYGCVPVAHATGGLRDTILDYADFGQSTGFLFQGLTADTLAIAIRRSLAVYAEHDLWLGLQTRGMLKDFSWQASAKKYLDLYRSSLKSYRTQSIRKVNP